MSTAPLPSPSTGLARGPSRPSLALCCTLLGVAIAATGALALSVGGVPLSPHELLEVLAGRVDGMAAVLVMELRLPRFVAGLLVGASLGLAGQLMQTVTRNPLASPGITGVVAGASMAVVMAQVGWRVDATWLPAIGMLGGAGAAALTFLLAARSGFSPLMLALAGMAVTALASALVTAFLLFSGAQAQQLYGWLAGGLQGRGWAHVGQILPWAAGGLVLSLATGRWLNLMHLEDSVARSLGGAVTLLRLGFVTLAVALTAASVAVAGPVGFIGLIAPHLVRLVAGVDQRQTLPLVALTGALLVTLSDLLARTLAAPQELPLGLFTALIGGPLFIALIRSRTP
ncbi:iron ABC transporter permease [Halomonas sp. MCCC 1A17488]|uniref:FecCD family ABC transporter permease n=1 Tax=unclassified Halomonas TaxID=2609666 RepID=UPI0018D21481|nr:MULTISPECIES: iron ABC transporter permease [unclassified Halomonas]MCE8016215.1 iron ABC transporter permease [Halomonas sp. MCCC 1A17488]MCG3239548.1 iron ABC transporter permease [Halomonas sp. MCCC 1A17488]QPP50532.1 iron ABC transporter permease [Halomonas sp. SS10-MC5]